MRNISVKVDNVDTLPADAFNSDQDELENVVTSSDQTLDPNTGPDTDLNMLARAIAGYANAGATYQDSGIANAYDLSLGSNLKPVIKYYDNMTVIFKAGNSSSGASTINVSTLGVKSLTLADGTALSSNDIVAGNYVIAVYNLGSDRFELTKAVGTVSDFPQVRDKIRNLTSSAPTVSTVDVDADEIVLQNTDSPPLSFVAQGVNVTADITASGVNGLDTGVEGSNVWYYIWIIFNGTTVASLLSLSATSPTMPSGYTFKALVGAVRNDATPDFVPFFQVDNKVGVETQSVTAIAGVTWTSVDVSSQVPTNAKAITLTVSLVNTSGVVHGYQVASNVSGGIPFDIRDVRIGSGQTLFDTVVAPMYVSQIFWARETTGGALVSANDLEGWEY